MKLLPKEANSDTNTAKVQDQLSDKYKGLTFKQFWDSLDNKLILYDYEEELINKLEKGRHFWVKKEVGLGITELIIRYIAWRALKDDEWQNSQVVIITGPNQNLSIKIIERIKALFPEHLFVSRNTFVELNGCEIESFPSHNLDAARSLPKPIFIFLDEADFFNPNEQIDARTIAERYITKSNPHIVLVSTPNLPGGLFETIEREEPCLYEKIPLLYPIGMNKMYDEASIKKAMESPSYRREHCGEYGYGIGNIFPYQLTNLIIESFDLTIGNGSRGLYLDPAFGNSDTSSKFAMLGMEKINGIKYVKLAQEYARASPAGMVDIVKLEAPKFGNRVRVDDSQAGTIRMLQEAGINCAGMNFKKELTEMVSIASQDVRDKKVRIHPSQRDLISQLVGVETNERGHPDKTKMNFDLGDTFIMACKDLKDNTVRIIKV